MRIFAVANIFKYERENFLLAYDVTSSKKAELVALKANFSVPAASLIQVSKYEEENISNGKISHMRARKIVKIQSEFVSFIKNNIEFLKQVLPVITKKNTKTNSLLSLITMYMLKRIDTIEIPLIKAYMTEEDFQHFMNAYSKKDEIYQKSLENFVEYTYMLYLINKAEEILKKRDKESDNSYRALCQTIAVDEATFFSFIREFYIDDIYEIVAKEDLSSLLKKAQRNMLSLLKQIAIYRKSSRKKMFDFTDMIQDEVVHFLQRNHDDIIILTGAAGSGKSEVLLKLKEIDSNKFYIASAVKETAEKRLHCPTIQSILRKVRKKDKKILHDIKDKIICVDEASYLSVYDVVTMLSLLNRKVIKSLVFVGDIDQTRIASHPSVLALLSLVREISKIKLAGKSYRFQDIYVVIDSQYDTTNRHDLLQINQIFSSDSGSILKLCISAGYQKELQKVINDIRLVSEVQGIEADESLLFLKYYINAGSKSVYTAITRAKKTAYIFLHKKESEKVWSLIENINDIINQKYQNVKVNFLYNGHIVDLENKEYRSMTDEEKAQWLKKIPRLQFLYHDIFSRSDDKELNTINQETTENNSIEKENLSNYELQNTQDDNLSSVYKEPWWEWNFDEVKVFQAEEVIMLKKDTELVVIDEDDFVEWIESHLEKEFPKTFWLNNLEKKKTDEKIDDVKDITKEDKKHNIILYEKIELAVEKANKILNKLEELERTPQVALPPSSSSQEGKKKRGRKPKNMEKIVQALKEHPTGLKFSEIMQITGTERKTLEVALYRLKEKGIIKLQNKGGVYMLANEKIEIERRKEEKIDSILEIVQDIRDMVKQIRDAFDPFAEKREEKDRKIDYTKIRH